MSLFCCDFFRSCNFIISDIFRMSSVIFAFFSEFKENYDMTLKERIKKLCKDRGISMNKLEDECGFAKGYISKLDKSTPNSDRLQTIADYFGVSLDFLMTGEEVSVKFSEANAELISKLRKDTELSKALVKYFELSDVQKEYIINSINLLHIEK